MKTTELIKEIQKLPGRKRIYVIERTLRLLRKQEEGNQMEIAEVLYEDYKYNKELTAFTNIDFDIFYEAR
jgi:predicted fused transcriptional regulator/phosphomethylpyrimidine kinase